MPHGRPFSLLAYELCVVVLADMRQVWSLQIVKKMLNSAGNSGNDAAGRFGKSNQETFDMDLIHELPPEETKQPGISLLEMVVLSLDTFKMT